MACDPGSPASVERPRSLWREAALVLGVVAVAVGGAFAYVFLAEPALRKTPEPEPPFGGGPPALNTPMTMDGLRLPPAVPAANAQLADDAPVLGISAEGKHRAYLLRAFASTGGQVVNDLLGDMPVTVTVCLYSERRMAFTSSRRGQPLDLGTLGWMQGHLLLRVSGGVTFPQMGLDANADIDPEFLRTYPMESTTWKTWRDAHPETDVYVGDSPDESRRKNFGKKSGS